MCKSSLNLWDVQVPTIQRTNTCMYNEIEYSRCWRMQTSLTSQHDMAMSGSLSLGWMSTNQLIIPCVDHPDTTICAQEPSGQICEVERENLNVIACSDISNSAILKFRWGKCEMQIHFSNDCLTPLLQYALAEYKAHDSHWVCKAHLHQGFPMVLILNAPAELSKSE